MGILKYLLIGIVVAFLMETAIKATKQDVNMWERTLMVVAWPIMLLIFIFYFIKGLLGDK